MRTLTLAIAVLALASPQPRIERPFFTSELLFPLEHWHNHASMVVELPSGELLACWFHGSGERTADDVVVLGARLKRYGLLDTCRTGSGRGLQSESA